jgi:hypothetical protein
MKKTIYILLTGLIISCSTDKNGGSGDIPEIPIDPGIYDIENLNSKPVVMGDHTSKNVIVPMDLITIEKPIGNVPTVPIHTGLEFGVYLKKTEDKQTNVLVNIDKSNFYLVNLLPLPDGKKIMFNLYSPISGNINIDLINSLGKKVKSFRKNFELGNNELTLDFAGFVDGTYKISFVNKSFSINFPLVELNP